MTTFHSRARDFVRCFHETADASAFNFQEQIAPSICKFIFTKHDEFEATMIKAGCSRTVLRYRFYGVEALPLVRTRFSRLANSSPKAARSSARRSRAEREASGRTSGEMSRVLSAQLSGSSRVLTTAMPPIVRQDVPQENLPW